MLIVLSGLPGVGKTMIARELARQIEGVHVRIDSIEQAMRDSGALAREMNDAGYRVAYAIAEDNLRLGRTVIADSVNPLRITRDAWREVASRAGVGAVEVEITCSDMQQHRQRVEARDSDIAGLRLPSWRDVLAREYEPWHRERIVLDTNGQTVPDCVQRLREALRKQASS